MTIDNELIDDLLKDYKKPEDLIGENGLLKQLTKRLLERAMAAELTEHVGYEKPDPGESGQRTQTSVLTDYATHATRSRVVGGQTSTF
jgi:putative transposase